MDTAWLWAERSTCSRLHVGCVIARESRILTTGYNGTPAGMAHCNHDCTCGSKWKMLYRNDHSDKCPVNKPCKTAVHAEANAITFAARYGLSLEGAFLYTTHMPCLNCCMLIVNSGVEAVVWEKDYRDRSGLELLEAGKIGFGKYNHPLPPMI
jgi:dCMP deaminase